MMPGMLGEIKRVQSERLVSLARASHRKGISKTWKVNTPVGTYTHKHFTGKEETALFLSTSKHFLFYERDCTSSHLGMATAGPSWPLVAHT